MTMFQNLKITAGEISLAAQQMRAGFAQSGRAGTFESNALRVIGDRVARKPDCYLEFGPYWWAVKSVLLASGYDLGDHGDPAVAAEYRGASDVETLVAGELFKDYYRATFFAGSNTFDLVGDGTIYRLEDPDLMARAASRSASLAA